MSEPVDDDYRDQIDMRSKQIVWQYGRTDLPSPRSGLITAQAHTIRPQTRRRPSG